MLVKMSDIFGKIKSGAGKVAKEADEFARIKRIELDISSVRRQIEDNYKKLGEITYKSSVNKEPEAPEVAAIIAKITELFDQIKAKEEEIKKLNLKPESEVKTLPTPTKLVCPSCGKEQETTIKFCPECGAKLG
jgi:rubrerythrin